MISVVKAKHDEVAAGEPAAPVPLRPARHRRRRAAARLHLGRRRGRRDALAARPPRRQRPVQPRHRAGPHLPRPGPRGLRRGRAPRGGWSSSTCRSGCAGNTSPSPRRAWTGCARPATRAVHRAGGRGPPLRAGPPASSRIRIADDPRPAVSAVRPGRWSRSGRSRSAGTRSPISPAWCSAGG